MPKITDNGIDYLQSQNAEEYEREARELRRYDRSLRDISDKLLAVEEEFYRLQFGQNRPVSVALQKAIDSVNAYQEMRTRK